MTILFGAMTTAGPMLATDSLHVTKGWLRMPESPKIHHYNEFLIAFSGSTADHHHYLSTLPPNARLDDPRLQVEHLGAIRHRIQQMRLDGEDPWEFNFAAMIADAHGLWFLDESGNLMPVRRWHVTSYGGEIVTYLLRRKWGNAVPTLAEFEHDLDWAIREAATVERNITPPVWIGNGASGTIWEAMTAGDMGMRPGERNLLEVK